MMHPRSFWFWTLLALAWLGPESLADPAPGAVRSIAAKGQILWALGDRGTVLLSRDAGRSFQGLQAEPDVHFQAVQIQEDSTFLMGGSSIQAHPERWGIGRLYQVRPDGSLHKQSTGRMGWIRAGAFSGETKLLGGESNTLFPSGLALRGKGSDDWVCLQTGSPGSFTGAALLSPELGVLVGPNQRVAWVRQGRLAPSDFDPRGPALQDAAFLEDQTCWAVGDTGTILASKGPQEDWRIVGLTLPGQTRRLADFQAIATGPERQAWIAGGLTGAILHTENKGGSFDLLPAPGPGPVHDLVRTSDGNLLAGGNAGRIWESTDMGRTWQMIHGRKACDVLVIAAASDKSIYPAIVAHSLAGCSVEVVFATAPDSSDVSGAQGLGSAAALAGASGSTIIGEFPTTASVEGGQWMDEEQILDLWSRRIDTDAREEMLLQLAAAIRLHRPRVLITGPEGVGYRGGRMETRLVSQLARQALAIAAGEQDDRGLAEVHLLPFKPERVFVGLTINDSTSAVWETPESFDPRQADVLIDQTLAARGTDEPLEMQTLRALAALGGGILDRPPLKSGYKQIGVSNNPMPLCTMGLTEHRLLLSRLGADRSQLAQYSQLALAELRKNYTLVTRQYTRAASQAPEADMLAADRLLVLWARLCRQGQWVPASQAQRTLLRHMGNHPWKHRFNCLALVTSLSAEARALGQANGVTPRALAEMSGPVDTFGKWWPWSHAPAGQVVYGHMLGQTGRVHQQIDLLEALAAREELGIWSTYATFETTGKSPDRARVTRRRLIRATANNRPGKLDGRIDEDIWDTAKIYPLVPSSTETEHFPGRGSLQLLRSPTHLLVGLKLSRAPAGWQVDLAIDSDRDAWTQLVVSFDTQANKESSLWVRHAPAVRTSSRWAQIRGRRTSDGTTFELALPLSAFGPVPADQAVWNLQLRASQRQEPEKNLMLGRSAGSRLNPEYAAALILPAAPKPPGADQVPPPSSR